MRRAILAAAAAGALSAGLAPSAWGVTPIEALRERGFRVRVKLSQLSGAEAYRVRSEGGLRFETADGKVVLETAGDQTLLALPEAVGSLPSYWRILLKRFEERRGAELYAQDRAANLGLATEILETPLRRPGSVERRDSPSSFAVVVGKFAARALAERALGMLPEVRNAEILFDGAHPFLGFLRILNAKSELAARAPAEAILRPRDEGRAIRIDGRIGGGAFRGEIRFFLGEDGLLFPVNSVDLEEYVRSVVPAEIGASAPKEALKAQAIAARSEAIHKMLAGSRYGDDRYDIVSTQQDQVYRGTEEETAESTRAVKETAGQALVHQGEVIDAVYSHSCGGITANSEDLWPGRSVPSLRSQVDRESWSFPVDLSSSAAVEEWTQSMPDVYCNCLQDGFPEYAKPYFRWDRTVPEAELARQINERGYGVGRLKDLRAVSRSSSGRVGAIEICGTDKTVRVNNGDTIRALLGVLPSTFFTMAISRKDDLIEAVTFHGAGYGHGVGLCQMGAYMMARRGYSCEKILQHYFADVEIKKIY